MKKCLKYLECLECLKFMKKLMSCLTIGNLSTLGTLGTSFYGVNKNNYIPHQGKPTFMCIITEFQK